MKLNGLLMFIMLLLMTGSTFGAESKIPVIDASGYVTILEKPLRPLTDDEIKALDNPGQKVLINQVKEFYEKAGFWYVVKVEEYASTIVYQDNQIQTVQEVNVVKDKQKFTWYKILCLVAMAFMFVSNVMVWSLKIKKNYSAAAVFAALSFVISILALFISFPCTVAHILVIFGGFFVAIFVLVAAIASIDPASRSYDKKIYKHFSVIFYLFMAAAFLM